MIKKILQYLAFYLDNLVNNLFPFSKTVRLTYKHWSKVDDFRQQAYIRVAVYLYTGLVITACYFEGWIGLVLIPATFAAYGIYYFLTKWLIKRKRNGKLPR